MVVAVAVAVAVVLLLLLTVVAVAVAVAVVVVEVSPFRNFSGNRDFHRGTVCSGVHPDRANHP